MRWAHLQIALMLFAIPADFAHADDSDELPTVQIMPCQRVCAQSTRAVTKDSALGIYPPRDVSDLAEAFVELRYTVGTDGLVKDMVVVHLVGPKEFADNAIDAAKRRVFTPATVNGQPVEQSLTLNHIYRISSFTPDARDEVISEYRQAVSLLRSGKNDDALAVLTQAQSQPRLNFYERGMLANVMALIDNAKGNYLDVRDLVTVPTTYFSTELPPKLLKSMLEQRIVADLNTGNIGDALVGAAKLSQVPGVDATDPTLKLVADARAKVDAAPEFFMLQRIPPESEADGVTFILSKRAFTFRNIVGSLDKFTISCRQQSLASKVTDNAEWHVPKDWDACVVFVQGAPGTTFRVIQLTE